MMIIAAIIGFLLLFTIIAGPLLAPILFLLLFLIPLLILFYGNKFFSLSPLVMAICPPGRSGNKLRLLAGWLVVVVGTILLVWGVGAISVVGLSSTPIHNLYLIPPPGMANRVGADMYNLVTAGFFLAVGFLEVGIPVWALITLTAHIIGGDRVTRYERRRAFFMHVEDYKKDSAGLLLWMASGVLPVMGIWLFVALPAVLGPAFPHLYARLGGWSPLIHLPGIKRGLDPPILPTNTWNNLINMFPFTNWSVYWHAMPVAWRIIALGVLIIAGLDLFGTVTGKNDAPFKPTKKKEAMAEYQRVMNEVHDENGNVVPLSEQELQYAKALESYWTGQREHFPKPEEFGMTGGDLDARIAARLEISRLAREKRKLEGRLDSA